jgi:hypothetical protein
MKTVNMCPVRLTRYTRQLLMVESTRIDHLAPDDFEEQAEELELSTGYSFNRLSRTRSSALLRTSVIGQRLAQLWYRGERAA